MKASEIFQTPINTLRAFLVLFYGAISFAALLSTSIVFAARGLPDNIIMVAPVVGLTAATLLVFVMLMGRKVIQRFF